MAEIPRFTHRFAVPLAAALIAVMLSGCSFYQLQAPQHPGVSDGRDVVWSYVWGLIPGSPNIDCNGLTLAEVTVKSNFAYDLLSVVTLGLISPKNVEWKCAGATATPGTISTPGSIQTSRSGAESEKSGLETKPPGAS